MIPVRPNPRGIVQHAHRRDYPDLDYPLPGRDHELGCSSKLGDGPLIAHSRLALEDTRPYGYGQPHVLYGSIYQYWRRTNEHPCRGRKPTANEISAVYVSKFSLSPESQEDKSGGRSSDEDARPENIGRRFSRPTSKFRSRYPQVDRLRPYDPIPPPSKEAQESALRAYEEAATTAPKLVETFESAFCAWKKTWTSSLGGISSE